MNQDIDTWFLVLGLFLPRVTLLAAYFTDRVPLNNVPFLLDILGTIFLPRVLICIYIAFNMGTMNGFGCIWRLHWWFTDWVHQREGKC